MRWSYGFGVVPGQQLVDVVLFVSTCDGGQDAGQIAVWVDPVEFAGFDQGRDDGPVLCAGIMSGEERVFAVQGNGADGSFDGIVVELDAAVVQEPAQAISVFGDVFQGLSGRRFGRDAYAVLGEADLECVDDGF